MAKIRFWRWQQTDELGMPCPTRFRFADPGRRDDEQVEHRSWPRQTLNPEQSRIDSARAAPPK